MTVAENHHLGRIPAPPAPASRLRRILAGLAGPALLFAVTVAMFWKLVLSGGQYSWLTSPDLINQGLPWLQFSATEWHRGIFPSWEPYLYGGQSILGQVNPGAAYPLNWVLFLLPFHDGHLRHDFLNWYFVLIHYMAALFCYWLCRDLKLSKPAALLGGAAFAFTGFVGTRDWPGMLNGAVWLPLIYLFLLRAVRGVRPVVSAALAGAAYGMAWLSGHHQIPIFTAIALAGTWLFYFLRAGRPDWRIVRLALIFGLFAILVGGLQIVPAYEYGKLAKRWVGIEHPVGWNERVPYSVHQQFSLYPSSLLGIAVPGVYRHVDPFTGLTVLSLAALGVVLRWHEPIVRLFVALGAGGLLFSLGANNVFHGLLYAIVPMVEKARVPAMAIAIFNFGIAVLAGYGLDSAARYRSSAGVRRIAFALAAAGGLLLALTGAAGLAGKPVYNDRAALVALAGLLMAALLEGARRGGIGPHTLAAAALALLLVETAPVVSYQWPHRLEANRMRELNRMQQDRDIAEFLRIRAWPYRADVDEKQVPFNFGDWHAVDIFGGYLASLPANLLRMGPHDPRMRRLYGVKYSIRREPYQEWQEEVFRGKSGLKVFAAPDTFPRLWTVHEAVQIQNEKQIEDILRDANFDLRRKTFLFTPPPTLEACEGDQARLIERDTNRVVIEAEMKCNGMVVLSDNYFPGWIATIDGRPVEIHEAYGAVRGVVAGPGRHRIEMHYRPRSVYAGAAMTVVGLLGAAFLAVRSGKRT